MKQITIRPDKYGRIANVQDLYLKFGNENLTTEVIVDFDGVKEWYNDYVKYAYVFVGKTRRATFYTSTGNTLTFLLTQEDLQTGYITIQPAAKLPNANPELIKHVQWEHIKFEIKKSYDPITQDTTITLSLAEILQNEIDILKLTKADKTYVDSQDLLLSNRIDDNDTDITNLQDNKVDKVTGKVLSSNDYTDEEKNKLSGISAGAEVNSVKSVATRTGDVVLTKSDVGLSNVDNTSDVNKPISTLQQEALNGKAPTVHTHTIAQVDNLQTSLDAKANKVQEAWITPTLLNGATGAVQYMKDNFGVVRFRGNINAPNGWNSNSLTMPVGYRVSATRFFMGRNSSNTTTLIQVFAGANGIWVGSSSTSVNVSLDSVSYLAEA